jgi:RNA polymerase sigma-70 factor, ECF subfamily
MRPAPAHRNPSSMQTSAPALSGGGFELLGRMRGERRRESGSVAAQRQSRLAERRLLRAAQSGDTDAQEELFRRHWRPMYRAAYLVVQDAAAAEDVAQEAFLAAIRSLDRFDLRRPLGPWLHRIAVNRAIDVIRARELRREVSGDAVGDSGRARAPDLPDPRAVQNPPLDDQLTAAIAALPVEQRAIVVMRYLLEYTPGEIARALELPRGTVNSRLRRGLDRLAATLTPEEES